MTHRNIITLVCVSLLLLACDKDSSDHMPLYDGVNMDSLPAPNALLDASVEKPGAASPDGQGASNGAETEI